MLSRAVHHAPTAVTLARYARSLNNLAFKERPIGQSHASDTSSGTQPIASTSRAAQIPFTPPVSPQSAPRDNVSTPSSSEAAGRGPNAALLDFLNKEMEEDVGNGSKASQSYRLRAFKMAIEALASLTEPVTSAKEAAKVSAFQHE